MTDVRIVARYGWVASLALALLVAPANAANASFTIPRAQLLATIKTIGVMPVEVDESVPKPDELAARAEQEIAARLQGGGFTVVPASEMRSIRSRGAATLGGIYDPHTGLPNREKLQALQEFSEEECRNQHPVDAILQVSIVRRQADYATGWAEWDGVRERVALKGDVSDALMQGLLHTTNISRNVPALSLAVKLVNTQGETIYTGAGGLLLLAYPTSMTADLVSYDVGSAQADYSLDNPEFTARALNVALDPLASGAVPDKPLQFRVLPPAKNAGKPGMSAVKFRAHKRLVLASLETLPPDFSRGDIVRARYRQVLTEKFTALGFQVVAGEDFDALWAAEQTGAGGFYDALTGHLDSAKLSASLTRVLTRLREHHDFDGVIMPAIVPRKAPFSNGFAHWDTVSESVSGGGSSLYNSSIFNPNLAYSGDLDANSLRLRILDDTGEVLYESHGGIELTQHVDHGRLMLVSEAALFTDPARDTLAVDAALHELSLVIKPRRCDPPMTRARCERFEG